MKGSAAARVRACLLATALVLAPGTAVADQAQARAHYERGRSYFELREYQRALDEFKAAHVEKADPAFLFNIAECYRKLGASGDALFFFKRFLAVAPAGHPLRGAAEGDVRELEAALREAGPPAHAEAAKASEPPPAGPVLAPPAEPAAAPPLVTATAMPAPAPAPSDGGHDPFYQRGWFWLTVGAVVVAAGTTAVILASRGGTSVPPTDFGNQHVDFHP